RIGTSSLRRSSQLKRLRPDFQIVSIRGNVQSRMKKMETENLQAVVLAAAGMIRLGYEKNITQVLPPAVSLPSVGQGALAIETRTNDPAVQTVVQNLHHEPTALCVRAERAFLRRLEGGCQVPIAGHAVVEGETLLLEGLVCDLEGKRYIRETISGSVANGEELGIRLADRLLDSGAKEILDEVYNAGR
ncbi:MAG: hydroxymethylbilane synthase, partial [Nitrospinae bacterium]|nr:hydroxymethylbilane synthase [Nitrospinota bacterium]